MMKQSPLSLPSKERYGPTGMTITLEDLLTLRPASKFLKIKPVTAASARVTGLHQTTYHARGLDFKELRIYHPGDDIRNMDWRSTARTGKPHSKLYHREKERPVFIVMSFLSSLFFGSQVCFKSILSAKIGALLGYHTIASGDKLAGLLYRENDFCHINLAHRQKALFPFFEALSQFASFKKEISSIEAKQAFFQITTGEPRNAFHYLENTLPAGSLCYWLSDFSEYSEHLSNMITRARSQCDFSFIWLVDPLEKQAPPPNYYWVGDEHQIIEWDTQSLSSQKAYENLFLQRFETVKQFCNKQAIPLCALSTTDPLSVIIKKLNSGDNQRIL